MSINNEKIYSLQGLRVVAMVVIFLYHLELFPFGHFAVTLFIILSGFVMYYSSYNKEINTNLKYNIVQAVNKIKKFYLIHILTLIIAILINFKSTINIPISKLITMILSNVFLVQAFIPNRDYYFSFNGVSWYLSVLLFCYFSFNFFRYIMKKLNNRCLSMIIILWLVQFVVSLACVNLSYDTTQWLLYINPINRSINFFSGMLLAKLFIEKKDNYIITSLKANMYEVGIISIFLIIYVCSIFIPRSFIWSAWYSPILMVIIFVFAFEKGILSKLLGNNTLVNIAKISFEFFMIHQIIINLLWRILGNKYLVLIPALLITTLLAVYANKILKKRVNNKIVIN